MPDFQSHPYRKTYKPFVLWLAVFFCLSIGVPLLAHALLRLDGAAITRVSLLFTLLLLALLFYVIRHGEYVYWINGGPSFEAARDAGRERRRAYAGAHLRLFCGAACAGALYLALSALLSLPTWLDVAAVAALLVAAALLALRIRFDA